MHRPLREDEYYYDDDPPSRERDLHLSLQAIQLPTNTAATEPQPSKLVVWILVAAVACLLGVTVGLSVTLARQRNSDTNSNPPTSPLTSTAATQISLRDAVNAGVYDGSVQLSQLLPGTTLGFGKLHQLDGEFVILDGQAFRLSDDGRARPADGDLSVTWGVTTNVIPTDALQWTDAPPNLVYTAGQPDTTPPFLSSYLSLANQLYCVRMHGLLVNVTLHVDTKQDKPYLPYQECVYRKGQTVTYTYIMGTLIGFRNPAYAASPAEDSLHFYFLSDDRLLGGDVVEFATARHSLQAAHAVVQSVNVILPRQDPLFDAAPLPYKTRDPSVLCP